MRAPPRLLLFAAARQLAALTRRATLWRGARAALDELVALREEADEELRAARKERKLEKAKAKAREEVLAITDGSTGDLDGGLDPEMAAMMGFGGFGSTKSKK